MYFYMVNGASYDIIWKNEEVYTIFPCINQLLTNSLLCLYLKMAAVTLVLRWVIWFSIVINTSFQTWNWAAYISFINIGREQSLISAFTDSLGCHMAENVLKVSIVSYLCIFYCYTFNLPFYVHVHEILEKH